MFYTELRVMDRDTVDNSIKIVFASSLTKYLLNKD